MENTDTQSILLTFINRTCISQDNQYHIMFFFTKILDTVVHSVKISDLTLRFLGNIGT
jgi:hypothetical protein